MSVCDYTKVNGSLRAYQYWLYLIVVGIKNEIDP
jgi:hypothetical protein